MMRIMAEAFALAGYVDDAGDTQTMAIPVAAAPIARAQGWMVLEPPTVTTRPDATGYSGPEDEDDGA